MTLSIHDLEKINDLAYLEHPDALQDPQQAQKLINDINAIMDFVDTLRAVDTTSSAIKPLFHPLDVYQELRPDIPTEEDCRAELEALAPSFEDNVYLVPKVLEAGN